MNPLGYGESTGPARSGRPDDRLREAIQPRRALARCLDCFVASRSREGEWRPDCHVALLVAALFSAASLAGIGVVDRRARCGAGREDDRIFNPRARPRRAAVAGLCYSRGPLAVAGADCRCRSAPFRAAVRVRGQAVPLPSGRRSAGAHARGVPACSKRAHSLGRLDADHAGGAAAGAAQPAAAS